MSRPRSRGREVGGGLAVGGLQAHTLGVGSLGGLAGGGLQAHTPGGGCIPAIELVLRTF